MSDLDELAKRILHLRQLEAIEQQPASPYNPCDGMGTDETKRFVLFLMEQQESIKEELKRANSIIADNTAEQKRLNALVLSLTEKLHAAQQKSAELARIIEDLTSSTCVSKQNKSNNH